MWIMYTHYWQIFSSSKSHYIEFDFIFLNFKKCIQIIIVSQPFGWKYFFTMMRRKAYSELKNICNGPQERESTENFRRRPCGYNIWYIWEVRLEQQVALLTMVRKEWQTHPEDWIHISDGFQASEWPAVWILRIYVEGEML